jgi:hypothetical protein
MSVDMELVLRCLTKINYTYPVMKYHFGVVHSGGGHAVAQLVEAL